MYNTCCISMILIIKCKTHNRYNLCYTIILYKYYTLLIKSILFLSIQPKLSLQYIIIISANIKKLSQYRYWHSFSDIGLVFLYWPSL